MKNAILFKPSQKQFLALVGIFILATASTTVHADLSGGLNTATSQAQTIVNWAKVILPVIAVAYLAWKAVEIWRGRSDWGDFAMAVAHVAIVGGCFALASWAFKVFQ